MNHSFLIKTHFLGAKIKHLRKNREKWEKRIKEIKAYDEDKQKRYSFEFQAGQTNIQAMNIREEKLEKKIKEL